MKKMIVLAALAMLTSATMAADKTWYAGLDVGSTKFKLDGDSENKTSYGATLGYQVNKNLAFEVQGHRLGKWDEDGVGLTVNSASVSGLLMQPVADTTSLYLRLGATRNTLHATANGMSASINKTKVAFGLGADFSVASSLSLRTEYVNLGKNDIGDGVSIKIQQFNVGLNYAF